MTIPGDPADPPPEAPADELDAAIAPIAGYLMEQFASPAYTPPMLPAVALEVHNLAHRPDVDAARVVGVLEKDPQLAGRVLKVAQSAAHARREPPRTLTDAVVHIGMRELSDLLWEVAFSMRVLRVPRYAAVTEAVIRHSTRCARLARFVCISGRIPIDYAFLCGLLHDVGATACLGVLAAHADSSRGAFAGHQRIPEALIAHTLRRCHLEATRVVARLWQLPAEVQEVVGHHHQPPGELSPALAGLVLADALAAEDDPGGWIARIDPSEAALFARAQVTLAFTDEKMADLREQATALLAETPAAAPETAAPSPPARLDRPVRPEAPRPPPRTAAKRRRRWYHFFFG